MDCREFRDKHTLFVDQLCSALDESEMRRHMRSCPKCSRHDTVIRRSLMLVKSLPSIDVSPDFRARLEARLHATASAAPARHTIGGSYASFFALAAGVAFVAYLAADVVRQGTPAEIQMAPVVASLSELELEPSSVATPALVATVPTGMSVWPAIMVASQAPIHFVAAEMATER